MTGSLPTPNNMPEKRYCSPRNASSDVGSQPQKIAKLFIPNRYRDVTNTATRLTIHNPNSGAALRRPLEYRICSGRPSARRCACDDRFAALPDDADVPQPVHAGRNIRRDDGKDAVRQLLPLLLCADVLTAIKRHEIGRDPRLPDEVAGLIEDEAAIVLQRTIRKFQNFLSLIIVDVMQHAVRQNNIRFIGERIASPILHTPGKEFCSAASLEFSPRGLDVDVADIKPHILYPWQTIQDVSGAASHIDKFLAVAQAKNIIDKPLPVCFIPQNMRHEAIDPREAKNRSQAGIDLHCGSEGF